MTVVFVRELDVRDLEPPEPFERCMEALPALQPGELLCFVHRREPFPLYAALDRLGFAHATTTPTEALVHVWIWRRDDEVARERAGSLTRDDGTRA